MSDFAHDMAKKYGKGVILGGNSIIDEEIQILPIGPSVDLLIGGGVPEGSWVNLSSKQGLGKTTLALQLAANCQKPEYGERDVYYIDIEGRLKKKNLLGIKGLRMDKFHAIRSTKEKILSAQDQLSIAEEILKEHERCVMILDSYSALCHEKELLEGIGTSTRGAGGYTLLSGFCRQMSQVVPIRKHIVIGIMQMMANPSGYGAALQEKGGFAVMHQGDVWLRGRAMKPWEDGGKPIGQIVTWQALKTAMHGGIVGAECDSYIRYGVGIDSLRELLQYAVDIGLIGLAHGGRYTCSYMQQHLDILGVTEWNEKVEKTCKFHGEHTIYKHMEANEAWRKALDGDIRKLMLGT